MDAMAALDRRMIEDTRMVSSPTGTQRAVTSGLALLPLFVDTAPMGVRTRGHDIAASLRTSAADEAARDEALRVIERWNRALGSGSDIWWSPTIRAALVAGTPWLDVYCPGCGTVRALDILTIDRHPLASVGSLVLGLRCSWCPGSAPMPKIIGLHALPPAANARGLA
jgi:hypothetical protein